jgi:hypothetical protein
MSADEVWRRYRRRGEVTAEQKSRSWTWVTRAGEEMQADTGDWAVIDDKGNERSVAAEVFDSTHDPVGPRRYRRSGTVLARRVTRQEVISTLEGEVVANKGDWVIRGGHGEQWPVPDRQFRDGYEGPLDPQPPTSGTHSLRNSREE